MFALRALRTVLLHLIEEHFANNVHDEFCVLILDQQYRISVERFCDKSIILIFFSILNFLLNGVLDPADHIFEELTVVEPLAQLLPVVRVKVE